MTDLRHLRRAGGDALRLLAEFLPAEWDPRNGEDEVSIVFADISGWSDLVATAGDDTAMDVLAVFDAVLHRAIDGRRGVRVVKRLGDGVMIAARRPADGMRVAVQLVESFGGASLEHGWPLRLRAGVHRGMTRRQGDDHIGYHVNLAARVAEAAPAGRALATAAAVAGVDPQAAGVVVRPAGQLHAKGVNGPVDLFSVLGHPAGATSDRLRAS